MSHASVPDGSPIDSIISRARPGAPPCSGPESEPLAATTALATSAPVLVTTRAVNVDAMKPWSMVATRYVSSARTARGSASWPVTIRR